MLLTSGLKRIEGVRKKWDFVCENILTKDVNDWEAGYEIYENSL